MITFLRDVLQKSTVETGLDELRETRRKSRTLYWFVGIFSFFANLLMLTGPLYMLQVYDRVLGSRSVETLIALSALVVFLYGMMGLLDYARGRTMARVGARFQSGLDRRVFDAVIRKASVTPDQPTSTGLRDLESIQRFMTSPVLMAVFDIPWTPFFLAGIWIFHPWLGVLALAGGAALILLTLINQMVTRTPAEGALRASIHSETVSEQMRAESEMVRAMGMRDAAFTRWQTLREEALRQHIRAADLGGSFTSFSKSLRLLLQSAMLGLGAYLVLQQELTPGAMIAASILLGRTLTPVEQAISQWPRVQRAVKGWYNLGALLGEVPPETPRTPLPCG